MKLPTIPINASNNFVCRNRCRYCGYDEFVYYYDMTNPYFGTNVRAVNNRKNGEKIKGWVNSTNYDYRRQVEYHKADVIKYYAHSIAFQGFTPKHSHNYANGSDRGWASGEVFMVVCARCQKQAWAYNVTDLPEGNRKARINCHKRPRSTYEIKFA
jgi:hypothetical protein